jgi:DNA-binding MarR family transcriptional regulator
MADIGEGGGVKAPALVNKRTDRSAAIIAVGRILDEFRRLNPNMPVAQIQAFLLVALDEGDGMTEIADKVDVKPSTASRYLIDLGSSAQDTYGLINRGFDSTNVRKARYHLTDKGKRLVKAISAILREEA